MAKQAKVEASGFGPSCLSRSTAGDRRQCSVSYVIAHAEIENLAVDVVAKGKRAWNFPASRRLCYFNVLGITSVSLHVTGILHPCPVTSGPIGIT